ncbi:MAG: site-specific integrase [Chlorobi bacterium]|nr:site-specific integrase [Chlorobiota bacterium]
MRARLYPRLHFYLLNADRPVCQVFACVVREGKKVRVSTRIDVRPGSWDTKRERLKPSARNATLINSRLDEIEAKYKERCIEWQRRGFVPSLEVLDETLRQIIGVAPSKGEMIDGLYRFIEVRRGEISESTVKTWTSLAALLERFQRHKGCTLTYSMFDETVLRDFIEYMLQVERYVNSQIQKVIKRLRTFLRFAKHYGYGESPALHVPVKVPTVERINRAYLRLDELEAFRTAPLTGAYAVARDLFVLQCYTGLRWSDLQRIEPSMYDSADQSLVLVTQKNRRAIRIPLLSPAKEILDRYQWKLPQYSNAYQNRLVKEALQLCGIATEHVQRVEMRGTQRIEEVVPKYELISTHSAKRTFVSLLVAGGVTLETICQLTGNTRATIGAYIHKDNVEARRELERIFSLQPTAHDNPVPLLVSPLEDKP